MDNKIPPEIRPFRPVLARSQVLMVAPLHARRTDLPHHPEFAVQFCCVTLNGGFA
jgi:hypothetical protein